MVGMASQAMESLHNELLRKEGHQRDPRSIYGESRNIDKEVED